MDISQVMGKSRVSVKNKIYNLGLSLKDNPQPPISYAVASLSLLSSKAPATDLKVQERPPIVEEEPKVLSAATIALRQADSYYSRYAEYLCKLRSTIS